MLCTRLEWTLVGDDQRATSLGLTLQERRRDFIEAGPATTPTESREVFLPWTLPHIYLECADIWNQRSSMIL